MRFLARQDRSRRSWNLGKKGTSEMSSRFARFGRTRLAAAAATSALVLGGGIATASAGYAAEGHDGHEGGGDACTFFLEHMWANEDGIPLLGSFAHFNEHHTDPAYENLVLSLASGAIGNSNMPIIDIYGGPLGWIPVFNPSHVKGHGTDYVTLLTSCGGIGIPLDSNDLTTLNVPSAEQLADLSDLIMPGLPTPEMLTDPNYIWETTDASAILDRVDFETMSNMDDYVNFAGDHFDTWRLLWETALNDVSSGNPSGILDVLQITDNVHTLESLSGTLGGAAPSGETGGEAPSGLLGGDALSGVLGGEAPSGETGGDTPSADTTTEYTVLMSGATDSSGLGQCQGTLSGNTFTITCLYAGMSSDVTGAELHSGDGDFQLTTTGGTSGGATGTVELTSEQVTALNAGEFTVDVHTANSTTGEISGVVKPCE